LARTQKRRVERPKQAPRPERSGDGKQEQPKKLKPQRAAKQPRPIEETLFFSRLRRQAKWVFVLLAAAFALTFVVFGVGSGGSGLGDVLFLDDNAGGGDTPSINDAEEAIAKNPDDAEAYYELSQAHQTEGNTEEAIDALVQYTALRPRDREKLEELAGLYLAQGQQAEQRAQVAQVEAQLVTGGGIFTPQLQGDKDQAVDLGVGSGVEDAVSAKANAEFNEHYQAMTTAYTNAKSRYEQVAELAPDDPTVYQNLALAAQQANDLAAAIEAYEKFLKLAPDDPSAGIIREQLKQLKASQAPAPAG
jgi:hypothetical protein